MQPNVCTTAGFLSAPGSSTILDNRKQGCYAWRVTYVSAGFSALSVQLEEAPEDNGGPGAWAAFTGSAVVTDGDNPSTNTTAGTIAIHSAAAFVRLSLVAKTGTGRIDYQVFGANGVMASGFSQATGNTGLRVATVTLSGAELEAINSISVTVIAAQGVGKMTQGGTAAGPGQTTVGTTPFTLYGNLIIKGYYGTVTGAEALPAINTSDFPLGSDHVITAEVGNVTAIGPKSGFDNKAIILQADPTSTGRITASNRTAANFGTGYVPTETFPVGGTNAIGVVDTVDGLGAVLTYHLSVQGTNIATANAVDCPGDIAGTGFQIDITAIQSVSGGDGTVTLTIPYIVVTLQ